MPAGRHKRLSEIALVFLKMGFFSFGGPAAHNALMEDEIVKRRKWITHQHFLDLMGATNLIPGPNSTELAMHCGNERAGIPGLIVAGLAFIGPAVLISGILGWIYVTYGQLPDARPLIEGIKPAVLIILASAVLSLGKKSVKGTETALIGGLTLVACIAGVNELLALLLAGAFGILLFVVKNRKGSAPGMFLPLAIAPLASPVAAGITAGGIFWVFLKIGSVLYGSGYVLFAYMDAELVSRGWLTREQLMDAIAAGQFTPGPLLSTATFTGYLMNGPSGAMLATAGIFLPSFIFVILLNPLIPRMRKSKMAGWFLDSVNVASVAVMASVLVTMSVSTFSSLNQGLTAIVCLIIYLLIKKKSPVLLIALGAATGYLLSLL